MSLKIWEGETAKDKALMTIGQYDKIVREKLPLPIYHRPAFKICDVKKEGRDFVVWRVMTKAQIDFMRKNGGLFPHKEITSTYKRGMVPARPNVGALAGIIEGYYCGKGKGEAYHGTDYKFLKIKLPAETKVLVWQGGCNLGFPYFIPTSRIQILSKEEMKNYSDGTENRKQDIFGTRFSDVINRCVR